LGPHFRTVQVFGCSETQQWVMTLMSERVVWYCDVATRMSVGEAVRVLREENKQLIHKVGVDTPHFVDGVFSHAAW
jgi:hypothetical protein